MFFSFVILYVFFRPTQNDGYRHNLRLAKAAFNQLFFIFAFFFGAIFFFLIKDFRRMILPYMREEKEDKKRCLSFRARKYYDAICDRRLLFYPDKEDYYIQVGAEDFDSIGDGEVLFLEVASVTGEVLRLKSSGRVFHAPVEFSYSE